MPSEGDVAQKLQALSQSIAEEEIQSGLVYGTAYVRKEGHIGKGILLIHGQSGNRYGLSLLANQLAVSGYFCLSIDLPSHYKNPNPLRVSVVSETILEAVALLQQRYGLQHIGIVGHSLGAVGALFASAGYTAALEESLYTIGDDLCTLLEEENNMLSSNSESLHTDNDARISELHENIDKTYQSLKELIFNAMKNGLTMRMNVRCYVLLAPPRNIKSAYPGLAILRRLNRKWIKKIAEQAIHKPAVKFIEKEGNLVKYDPEEDPAYVNMQFFKTKEVYEFLEYIMAVKEPVDFLSLLEYITNLKRKEDKTNLIQYYYEKYIGGTPKLFIYGRYDMLLRPFLPFEKGRLEKMYRSCGNAEIYYGSFSHVMVEKPRQQLASVAVRNDAVLNRVTKHLDRYLRGAR